MHHNLCIVIFNILTILILSWNQVKWLETWLSGPRVTLFPLWIALLRCMIALLWEDACYPMCFRDVIEAKFEFWTQLSRPIYFLLANGLFSVMCALMCTNHVHKSCELSVHFPHDFTCLGAQTYADPIATFFQSKAEQIIWCCGPQL